MITERVCTKCGEIKELSMFPKSKRTLLGVGSWCRKCKGVLDAIRAKKFPKEYAEIKRKSYDKNKERYLERSKQWDKDHPKEALDRHRRYYEKYPELPRLWAHKYATRRSNAPGRGVSSEDWKRILEFYGNKCLKCGSTEKITLDHVIPLTLGGWHDPSNIQPLCLSCNSGKQNRSCADYRPWNKKAREWIFSFFK